MSFSQDLIEQANTMEIQVTCNLNAAMSLNQVGLSILKYFLGKIRPEIYGK